MSDLRESLRKCIDAMPDPVTRAEAWKGYALAVEEALENAQRRLNAERHHAHHQTMQLASREGKYA